MAQLRAGSRADRLKGGAVCMLRAPVHRHLWWWRQRAPFRAPLVATALARHGRWPVAHLQLRSAWFWLCARRPCRNLPSMPAHPVPVRKPRFASVDVRRRGMYFLTFCTHLRRPFLGEVTGPHLDLSPSGAILRDEWLRTFELREDAVSDVYAIGSDHFHGMLSLVAPLAGRTSSLSSIVSGVKAAATRRINALAGREGFPVWQRGYHFRFLDSPDAVANARRYVLRHPAPRL